MNTMLKERKKANQGYKLGVLIRPTPQIKENSLESNGLQKLITIGLNTTRNKLRNQVGRIFGDKMIVFMPVFGIFMPRLYAFNNFIQDNFELCEVDCIIGIKIGESSKRNGHIIKLSSIIYKRNIKSYFNRFTI